MKLSTTKMLCVGPTPRQNAVAIPGGSWRTYSTRMLGRVYGGSAAPSTASTSRPLTMATSWRSPAARMTRSVLGNSSLVTRAMIDEPVTRWVQATGRPRSSSPAAMRS